MKFGQLFRQHKFSTADISPSWSATKVGSIRGLANGHLFPEFGVLCPEVRPYHAATCVSPSLMHVSIFFFAALRNPSVSFFRLSVVNYAQLFESATSQFVSGTVHEATLLFIYPDIRVLKPNSITLAGSELAPHQLV